MKIITNRAAIILSAIFNIFLPGSVTQSWAAFVVDALYLTWSYTGVTVALAAPDFHAPFLLSYHTERIYNGN